MFIPKGVTIVGRIHNTDHVCMIEGDLLVSDDESDKHYTGFNMFKSKHGVKRIVQAKEDTRFTTIHHVPGADKMTIEEIESIIASNDYMTYEELGLST
jgi:hypothetical protein